MPWFWRAKTIVSIPSRCARCSPTFLQRLRLSLMWCGIVVTTWIITLWVASHIGLLQFTGSNYWGVVSGGIVQINLRVHVSDGVWHLNTRHVPLALPAVVVAVATLILGWSCFRAALKRVLHLDSPSAGCEHPMNALDRGRRRVILWSWVLALCAGGVCLGKWQRHRAARELAAWSQQERTWSSNYRRCSEMLTALRRRVPKPTLDELEHLLNGGRPFPRTVADRHLRAIWTDASTGITATLIFVDVYMGKYEWVGGSLGPGPPRRPSRHLSQDLTTTAWLAFAGQSWLGIGTGQWLLLVLLWLTVKEHRMVFSELMLAATVLCATAWSVDVGYVQQGRPVWALGMAVCSVFLMWLSRRWSRMPSGHFCRSCGYDLTGNVSGVCPECGTPISTAASSATVPSPSSHGTPRP